MLKRLHLKLAAELGIDLDDLNKHNRNDITEPKPKKEKKNTEEQIMETENKNYYVLLDNINEKTKK